MSNKEKQTFPIEQIKHRIYFIRDVQVILDCDLSIIYGVETKQVNRAVKRNEDRFPEEFIFQLTKKEWQNLKFQTGTSSEHGGRRKLPYVFTEQGVAMLSAVLRSDRAIKVSVQIINAFVAMRKFIGSNAKLFQRINQIELKQLTDKSEIDVKFERIFDAIEQKEISPKQGIIYNGQIFDAHALVSKIIQSAKKSIIIIDNYIDDSVLTLLTNRKKGVRAKIYTKSISKRLALDIKKFKNTGEAQMNTTKKPMNRFRVSWMVTS